MGSSYTWGIGYKKHAYTHSLPKHAYTHKTVKYNKPWDLKK